VRMDQQRLVIGGVQFHAECQCPMHNTRRV
jgi:hypothetical protein